MVRRLFIRITYLQKENDMRNLICLLVIIAALAGTAYPDEWARPTEEDYFSPGKRFVAHVTPAKGDAKARLEMFRLDDSDRIGIWQCALGNEGVPMYVFITDDGQYVATVNENNDRVHGGMGDYVVAFYDKTGLIKNYPLEEILHYTGPPNRLGISKELRHLVSRSKSGRSWAAMPMFFDKHQGRLYFCVWLYGGKYFLAWDATSGAEVKVTDEFKERWNEKGRQWALTEGIKSRYYGLAVDFLLMLRRPEDRKAIESLLRSEAKFYSHAAHDSRTKVQALAKWDEQTSASKNGSGKNPYFGAVSGTIRLPEAPGPDKSHLCLYLIRGDSVPDNWYKSVPVHRVTEYFWKYSYHNVEWPGAEIPFRIQGVAPGKYTLKAVWDKAGPRTFGDDYIKGPPQKGDYQSKAGPTIIVSAGKKIEDVNIDCTDKVAEQGG